MKIVPLDTGKRPILEKRNESLDPYPKLLQHILCISPTQAGKSTVLTNMLLGPYNKKFDRIWIFSGTWAHDMVMRPSLDLPEEQIFTTWRDDILDAIEADIETRREKTKREQYDLLLLDDCLDAVKSSKRLASYVAHCRHSGITCWFILQAVRGFLPKPARINFGAVLVFANIRDADAQAVSELCPVARWKFFAALDYVRGRNAEDGSIRHFLLMNCGHPDVFFMDLDVPLRIREDVSRPRKRVGAGSSSRASAESDDEQDQ